MNYLGLVLLFPVLVLRAGFGILIASIPDLCILFTFDNETVPVYQTVSLKIGRKSKKSVG